MQKNSLTGKIRFILKFKTSQHGKKTIATHILHNIAKTKGNQTMRFGQLIEYNIRNIFLEKSHPNCGGGTIARPFSKKENWAYLCITILKFHIVCAYRMST